MHDLVAVIRSTNCRRITALAHHGLACIIAMLASESLVVGAVREPSAVRQIGEFTLLDVDGARHTRDEYRAKKVVVLFFLGTECPVSNGYAPDMHRISDKYAGRNVTCFGVHCDPTVTAATAATHAREYGLKFPILLDPTQQLARESGVRVTPEAVLVSPAGNVLYRGRIDDRYAVDGKRRDSPQSLDLERALDAVLAGGQPPVGETKAFGCPLPRPKATAK